MDYNAERSHKSLGYLSPIKFSALKSLEKEHELELYLQTANGNYSNFEESRLVGNAVDEQKIIVSLHKSILKIKLKFD